MWFGWSGLGGIWGFEGLDNMDLLEFLRGGVRKKDPGLNLLDSIWFIQGAEAPCSLRRTDKGKGENRQGQGQIRRFWLRQNDDVWGCARMTTCGAAPE
jgi:hypothetical protein